MLSRWSITRKIRPVQLAHGLILMTVVAALTAALNLYATWISERDLRVAAVDGERMVQFNLREGAADLPSWTPQDLRDLQSLPNVSELVWHGAITRHVRIGSSAITYADASPGYHSFFRVDFVAGRDLTAADADRTRVVVSEKLAAELFPGVPFDSVLGRTVQMAGAPYTIVGVYEGSGAAYRARSAPARGSGGYNVSMVYARLAPGKIKEQLSELESWVAARDHLAAAEPVLYRAVANTNVQALRTPFVGEVIQLTRILLGACLVLGVVTLLGHASLSVLERSDAIILRRALGSTVLRTAMEQVGHALMYGLPAVVVGVAVGSWIAHYMGAMPSGRAALYGAGAGWALHTLGSLVALRPVLRSSMAMSFMAGQTGLLRPVGNRIGNAAIILLMFTLTVAGAFAASGDRHMRQAIESVGADRVELVSGGVNSTRLPAILTRADLGAIRESFPKFPAVYVVQSPAELRASTGGAEATVYLVDGEYEAVSGTRLSAGTFWTDPSDGVVLGSGLAQALFPDGDAIGQEVTIAILGISTTLPVTGVATDPATEYPDSLQLASDRAVIPARTFPISHPAKLQLRIGDAGPDDLAELVGFMNARHPNAAPFHIRFPSQPLRNLWEYFQAEKVYLKALATVVAMMAAVGSTAFLHAEAVARQPVYALCRALGASQRYLQLSILSGRIGRTLLVGWGGVLLGVVSLFILRCTGYTLAFPTVWILVGTAYCVAMGVGLGIGQVRWMSLQSPMSLLRGER